MPRFVFRSCAGSNCWRSLDVTYRASHRARTRCGAEVARAAHLRLLAPDHLKVCQRAAAGGIERELRARDCRAPGAIRTGFGIAHVDEIVGRERGWSTTSPKPPCPPYATVRHALDDARAAAERVDLQRAALLGDEQAPIRQEGHGPRLVEPRDLVNDERIADWARGRRRHVPEHAARATAATAEQGEQAGESGK